MTSDLPESPDLKNRDFQEEGYSLMDRSSSENGVPDSHNLGFPKLRVR